MSLRGNHSNHDMRIRKSSRFYGAQDIAMAKQQIIFSSNNIWKDTDLT